MKIKYSVYQVYTDVLMCFLMMIIMMLCLMFVSTQVQKVQSMDAPKPPAQELITLIWDDHRDVDLDLWLKIPSGELVYYNNRETPNISLDRDSRGYMTNRTKMPDGSEQISSNREVTTIRAIVPGDYVVLVNYYADHQYIEGTSKEYGPEDSNPAINIDCQVSLDKVNPKYTEIKHVTLHLTHVKETQNAFAFRINNDGSLDMLPTPTTDIIRNTATTAGQ